MSQFEVGDRVVAASTDDVGEGFRGLIGTVVDHQSGTGYPYVDFDDPPPGTEHGTPDGRGKAQGGTWPGPCLTPLDHPALRSVTRAMGRAFETPVRFTREGGSGPAADLQDVLGAPVLFLGISVPSDGWHAPNEKVELDLVLKGVETTAYLWGDLAENWRHEP